MASPHREFLRQAEGIQTHRNAMRQDRRQFRGDDLPRYRRHPLQMNLNSPSTPGRFIVRSHRTIRDPVLRAGRCPLCDGNVCFLPGERTSSAFDPFLLKRFTAEEAAAAIPS